ncbi:DUF1648 domain-containing protein [Clostridium sp. BNL1100]|uniref:DUF1648 domain-containing protein n=1 Tax=Clostridium sp. BNL1100 TaxID=755731 RepID=UPI00024A71BE|nr:DUF1648 domain-containing protein [Clostridium sp. BNL1100]AEY67206.1 Protein of unknown function (DUF1648) [Clostridium sp. BNL1100]
MKKKTIIGTVICILTMVIFLVFYKQLPADVPIHFDSKGNVNSSWPKEAVVFGIPLAFAVLNVFVSFALQKKGEKRDFMYYILPAASVVTTIIVLVLALK